jgi:class 3 adenylate cyclase
VVDVPEIRYARSADVAIAYQVVGEGPSDLVFVPTFGNLVFPWFNQDWRSFYDRVASFARLILLDKRGTGLSDRPRDLGTLETRMDDLRAVLDAVGTERAVVVGSGPGGQPCAMFAATYPERTRALVLVNTPARLVKAQDYPYGLDPEAWREQLREVRQRWGERDYFEQQARVANPNANEEFVSWFVTCQRFNASPGAALNFYRVLGESDLRDVLSSINVPTLVLHGPAQREEMLDVARRIRNARAVALPGDTLIETFETIARETKAFIEDAPPDEVPDSVLATVLFTDLVGSTERAATLGDRAWRDLLMRHHEDVRRELARFRGEEIDAAGDGFFCRFDGPARAIACATRIAERAGELDLAVRAGVHIGECEVAGEKLAGIAVVTGARIAALAGPGEVFVSQTVRDLVAGSGFEFIDRGIHQLKGVPGDSRLYSVATTP